MSNDEYMDLLDELFNANQILEVCQGYTQADIPDTKALGNVLWMLMQKYADIYLTLKMNSDYIAGR